MPPRTSPSSRPDLQPGATKARRTPPRHRPLRPEGKSLCVYQRCSLGDLGPIVPWVCWRPSLAMTIVTHLATQLLVLLVGVTVVDEPQPLVICSCGLAPRPRVTWVFGSRQFSSLHVVSGAHVPWMCPASAGDRLLRRSLQAGGQPARAQIGGRSWCPWVTAGDRSFPLVLVRKWHGACRSTVEDAADGMVDS